MIEDREVLEVQDEEGHINLLLVSRVSDMLEKLTQNIPTKAVNLA